MAKGCWVTNAVTDDVKYATNAGSINWGTGWSMCFWHKAISSDAGYLPLALGQFTNSDFFAWGHASAFGSFQLQRNGGVDDASGGGPTTDEWFFGAISVIENSASGVLARTYDDTMTLVKTQTVSTVGWATGHTATLVKVCSHATTNTKSGRTAQARMWDGVLSQAEFEAEMASSTVVKTSGLINAVEDDPSVDLSGNADPWDAIVSIDISAADWPPNYVEAAPALWQMVGSGIRFR